MAETRYLRLSDNVLTISLQTVSTEHLQIRFFFVLQSSWMNAFTGLEVEGIFRRSASAVMLRKVQGQFNEGQRVDFATIGDIHIPAAILKSFLRQLPEPILTYDLYDHIIHVQCKHFNVKIHFVT